MKGRAPDARTFALFYEALDQRTAEREAWLAEACDDTDLRNEVAAMLTQAQSDEPGPLDRPLLSRDSADGAPEAEDPRIGQRIGVWRVTGLLGRGGMGSVYRAARDDGAYEQQAAIKLGHPGMRPDVRARFLTERALLAQLDHPGIARLLDGGVAPDGAPFLAMEVVDGQPITAYAEAHDLDVRQRLALFVEACEAVAYAHRNLVVHRDLKPDHILVEEGGESKGEGQSLSDPHPSGSRISPPSSPRVKLLDFGVAKLLAPEADVHTRTGMGPLTPAYAAPEQFLGQSVTTATDVYALGVVLYELVAGHRPYEVTALTAAQAERVVCETAPVRPASVAGRTGLSGDLDTICLKALAKEPERRYASADALADDVGHFLDELPILARPSTPAYRLSRFVRRHRAGVGTSAAVLVLAIATVAFYTVRLRAERDRAEAASVEAREETDRAEAIADFLESILRAPNTNWYVDAEAKGPDTPIRAVLAEASARVDRDLAARPDLRADLHHILGDTYLSMGLADEARRHHRTVLALRESLYTPPHPKLAEALYYAAGVEPAGAERVRLFERAAEMLRQRPGGSNLPFILNDLGGDYTTAGYPEIAEPLLEEGLAYMETHFTPGTDGHRYRAPLTPFLSYRLADARLAQGDLDGASQWLRVAGEAAPGGNSCIAGRWHLARGLAAPPSQKREAFRDAERLFLACHQPDGAPSEPLNEDYRNEADAGLVALYEAEGRPEAAAPHRAGAARLEAFRDSLHRALRSVVAERAR